MANIDYKSAFLWLVVESGEAYGIQVAVDEATTFLAPQICPGHRAGSLL